MKKPPSKRGNLKKACEADYIQDFDDLNELRQREIVEKLEAIYKADKKKLLEIQNRLILKITNTLSKP